MKKYFALLTFIAIVISINAKTDSNTENNKTKTCYDDYYEAFMTRGAVVVSDGEHQVVFSLRTDTGCVCGEGKVTVKNGMLVPIFLIKKIDGTYEPAKRKLHPKMKKGDAESPNLYNIYMGMSQSFMTEDYEIADFFFIDALKRKVVPNSIAPSPDDIAGVNAVMNEKEKEIIQKAYEGLVFETGKAKITSASFPHLNLLASMLSEKKEYKLNIHGFTDNVGGAELNLKLSQERADAVKAYLIKQGLDASRISSHGFGMENPIGDNSTPSGRAENRRVEFLVVQ